MEPRLPIRPGVMINSLQNIEPINVALIALRTRDLQHRRAAADSTQRTDVSHAVSGRMFFTNHA